MELQSPYLLITSGFLAFASVNFLTRFITPRAACQTVKQKWKWRNVATSLVHSVVTGIWAPICFMQEPDMHTDLIRNFTGSSHALVSVSIGYFLYDALDMVVNNRKRSTAEYCVHHFFVVLCFGLAVVSHQYVAYGALSLMVEINSIFLHSRQLLIITHQPKSTSTYKTNALFNVATFVTFRILLLGWMTRWLTVHREEIPLLFFTAGSIGLAVIVAMNIILFCRILSVDFPGMFRLSSPCSKENSKQSVFKEGTTSEFNQKRSQD